MPTTYEAELALLSGPQVARNHEGYSGSGFADYVNPTGDYIEFSITVEADGLYDLGFRYALGRSTSRPLQLAVDGEVITTIDFSSTGDWASWQEIIEQVQLTSGTHTIRLTATGASG